MVYYVYLLKTLDGFINKSYVGYTNNLSNRIDKHNNNLGAKSTKGYKWQLIYKKKISIIAQIIENSFNNKKSIQLNIKDLFLSVN